MGKISKYVRNKDKEILPMEENFLSTWAEQNVLISIVSGIETGWDWILNTHIQLRGSHYIYYEGEHVDTSITFYPYSMHNLSPNLYDFCPFIEKYTIPKDMIRQKYKNFSDFVKFAIKSGYYVSTYLDQYFREDIRNYGFHHPSFLYGYNEQTKTVFLMDNFENNKYKNKEIRYETLNNAFNAVSGNCWEVSVFLYKPKLYHHDFYSEYVREQILDYLHPNKGLCYMSRTVCMNPHFHGKDYENDIYYGMDCYMLLREYLHGIIQKNDRYIDGDWRNFSMLKDHKILMQMRYQFMVDRGYAKYEEKVLKGLNLQKQQSEMFLNLFIKYRVTKNRDILYRILEYLDDFTAVEEDVMERFAMLII